VKFRVIPNANECHIDIALFVEENNHTINKEDRFEKDKNSRFEYINGVYCITVVNEQLHST